MHPPDISGHCAEVGGWNRDRGRPGNARNGWEKMAVWQAALLKEAQEEKKEAKEKEKEAVEMQRSLQMAPRAFTEPRP